MSMDLQLFFLSVLVGIMGILLPRTKLVIIVVLLIIFILSCLVIWFGQIIPHIIIYQIFATILSLIILLTIG